MRKQELLDRANNYFHLLETFTANSPAAVHKGRTHQAAISVLVDLIERTDADCPAHRNAVKNLKRHINQVDLWMIEQAKAIPASC